MKRFIFILIALAASLVCKAQYNPYCDAYEITSAMTKAYEDYKLGNIRFDENAMRESPQVWAAYQQYLMQNEAYLSKARKYKTVMWAGVGVGFAGMIPIMLGGFGDYDSSVTATNVGIAISSVGMITGLVGGFGLASVNGRLKTNKKEFIYYLRANNNGVGIVTLF